MHCSQVTGNQNEEPIQSNIHAQVHTLLMVRRYADGTPGVCIYVYSLSCYTINIKTGKAHLYSQRISLLYLPFHLSLEGINQLRGKKQIQQRGRISICIFKELWPKPGPLSALPPSASRVNKHSSEGAREKRQITWHICLMICRSDRYQSRNQCWGAANIERDRYMEVIGKRGCSERVHTFDVGLWRILLIHS